MTNEATTQGKTRRRTAVVQHNDVSYTRNLSLLRRTLTLRQVEGFYLGGLGELANQIGTGRSTVSRFFSGYNVRMDFTQPILGALKLKFDDVHTPYVRLLDVSDDHH